MCSCLKSFLRQLVFVGRSHATCCFVSASSLRLNGILRKRCLKYHRQFVIPEETHLFFSSPHTRHCSSTVASTSGAGDDKGPKTEEESSQLSITYGHNNTNKESVIFTLTLPSTKEPCQFMLRPAAQTVGDLTKLLFYEDAAIRSITICDQNAVQVAPSVSIEQLLQMRQFHVQINGHDFIAHPPSLPQPSSSTQELERIKALVTSLYTTLNVEEFQQRKEAELLQRVNIVRSALEPLEQERQQLAKLAEQRTSRLLWVGLTLTGIQFGFLARLTWWEYSWDIMEPVTYFCTYATVIGGYAYFVLTRQQYEYPEARDRIWLFSFYKKAKHHKFDVAKYNQLKIDLAELEADLRRIRDPLYFHLPIPRSIAHGTSPEQRIGGNVSANPALDAAVQSPTVKLDDKIKVLAAREKAMQDGPA